ncbi:MAG: hypothetical protein KGO81_03860 [Bacteroidota bacterium]|nr:hypothetical protein [Bacteroidota bacterium]
MIKLLSTKQASFVFIVCITVTKGIAQVNPIRPTTDSTKVKVEFSGFIRNDIFFDSRQVISSRPASQGELLLYPAPVVKDANGNDINANPSLTILAITSRAAANITGPKAFGAKTSGVLEGEFYGNLNGNENVFHLRHAYAKLDWGKSQLLFGQYWHPLLNPECFPQTEGFSVGIPFVAFARNPQVRFTRQLNPQWSLTLAALSEIEVFSSAGSATGLALGAAAVSSNYINNAILPNVHAQLMYKSKSFLWGIALDYKSLQPALKDSLDEKYYSVHTKVNSLSFETYAKLVTKKLVAKTGFVAGQNLYDMIMLGGYFAYGTHGNITYQPDRVNAAWLDIAGTGKKIVPAIFVGYTQNMGATKSGAVASYARGISIGGNSLDNLWRIAPRCDFISGKFKFGTEVEMTAAAYGIAGSNGKVTGLTTTAMNTRILFVTVYAF